MADDGMIAEAIEWRLRLREERPEEWEAFVPWLEGDPARSAAYDEVALAEDDADAALAAMPVAAANDRPAAANDDDASSGNRWSRRSWVGGAIAGAAALLVGVAMIPNLMARDEYYTVSTGSGGRQVIALGSGNNIELNGASRLTLRKGDDRYASLESGEAHFSVRHDAARPFQVALGDEKIVDVGTRFNVIRDPLGIRVAVAEGKIMFDPDGSAVSLAAGQSLRQTQDHRRVIEAVDPDAVGGWRNGQLAYHDVPLADVANDLSRVLGTQVTMDPSIAQRPFTGVIRVGHDHTEFLRRLGMLLDVDVSKGSNGLLLAPHSGADQ